MTSITELIAQIATADQIKPLSEQFEPLAQSLLPGTVSAVQGHTAEFAVAPELRGRGLGMQLLQQLKDAGVQEFWAHGNLLPAQKLAAKAGLKNVRTLQVYQAPPTSEQQVVLPAGFHFTTMAAAGETVLPALLEVNNAAFSWHPEQGGWDLALLQQRLAQHWVKPEKIFLLWEGKQLAGFHWTKESLTIKGEPIGEVYVIGLHPDYQGKGLAKPLLQQGLNALAGLPVELYVEKDNTAAVALYQCYGFQLREEHSLFQVAAAG